MLKSLLSEGVSVSSQAEGNWADSVCFIFSCWALPDFSFAVGSDLLTWAHHTDLTTIPDKMLLKAIEEPQLDCPAELHAAGGPESEGMKGVLQSFPGYFQPITFAMSCRIEFKEDVQELQQSDLVI